MKKVFIVGGDHLIEQMFVKAGWEISESIQGADLVQFTGGSDVSPHLYGETHHPSAWCDARRDRDEAIVFNIALRNLTPMAGICRGGQFLNVMNGGKMYQDVDAHAIHGTHVLTDLPTGEVIKVTSTHHQMMIPSKDGKLVAIATLATRKEFMDNGQVVTHRGGDDTEVVFYKDTMCLCFQPHPEYNSESTRDYYFKCLSKYLHFK